MTRHVSPRDLYASTARYDGTARALTEAEMRKAAPSIFAVAAHESRSQRFVPIPTYEIVKALQAEGFAPVAVKQCSTRVPGKLEFTKHLIRFRRLDDKALRVGDSVVETILQNANDGTSRYRLETGLMRALCLNSLYVQTDTIDTVKIGHSGNGERIRDEVIEGTYRVIGEAEKVLEAPQDWPRIKMARDEARAFAEAAHVLRFGDEDAGRAPAIAPEALLRPRRAQDTDPNLWNIFNVVQENAIRGGLHGVRQTVDEQGRAKRRNVTTREIHGIDQDTRLNKALWVLAARMAEMKAAA